MAQALTGIQPEEALEFQNGAQSPTDAVAAERRRLVSAATQAAVDRLLVDIEAQPVQKDLTVGQLLGKLGARPALRETLAASPQLGRARFPLPGTAEVQLQAMGEDVAAELVRLTRAAGPEAPIAPADLEQRLSSWRGKTFVATGGSAAADVAPELRFPPDRIPPSWVGVTEQARRQAVTEANGDLVNKLMNSAGKIEVGEHAPPPEATEAPGNVQEKRARTLKEVFNTGSIGSEIRAWLSEQPYSRLEFGAGRTVEVKLSIEPREWVEQLRVSMASPDSGLSGMPPEEWEKLEQRLIEHVRSDEVVGMVGHAVAPDSLEKAPPALQLPKVTPDWTRLPVTAEASAAQTQGAPARMSTQQLMTRNEATELARQQLRTRLEQLPVAEGQTLGHIAQQHPAVDALIGSAVKGALVTSTRYANDGSATVQISVNPLLLWRSLHRYAGTGSASLPRPVTSPVPAQD